MSRTQRTGVEKGRGGGNKLKAERRNITGGKKDKG